MSDHSPFPTDVGDARADVAAALRDIGHALVGHHVEIGTAQELTAALEGWAERLAAGPSRDRVIERPTGDWGPPPGDGEEMLSYDERPISGRSSPWGLDMRVIREGDEAVGYVTLGSAHEGAPGRSHGGIVAALFDDLFGFVLTLTGRPAFTGELTVRYEQGVPIHQPLECRVRMSGKDGRKIQMTGELLAPNGEGGQLVVSRGRAVFIEIDPALFRARAD